MRTFVMVAMFLAALFLMLLVLVTLILPYNDVRWDRAIPTDIILALILVCGGGYLVFTK